MAVTVFETLIGGMMGRVTGPCLIASLPRPSGHSKMGTA
jgi:hypothetical protein